jgi:hypothetical protein
MKVADHSPAASERRSMKCRILGQTGVEGSDMSLGDGRASGP